MRARRLGLTTLTIAALLTGCAGLATPAGKLGIASGKRLHDPAVAGAAFGPDERLWRLIVADRQIYVDSSEDHGASYSAPVAVSPDRQSILARAEDRPSIGADARGWVYVLYTVGTIEAPITYLVYSTDAGRRFSTPRPITDPAHPSPHYQGAMVVDTEGRLYVFWNDERGRGSAAADRQGASLYSASNDRVAASSFSNRQLVDGLCNCCRLAVDLDVDGLPVVFARFVFPDQVRDHGMLKASPSGLRAGPWRVTEDDWRIEACPMHGPALAIARDGRYHITWFTQGSRRQGLYYAHSDDRGRHFSAPAVVGRPSALPGHADLLSLGPRVVLTWREFDGTKTRIMVMQSRDRGDTWSAPVTLAHTEHGADHPFLISDEKRVFLSWNSVERGHQLIPID